MKIHPLAEKIKQNDVRLNKYWLNDVIRKWLEEKANKICYGKPDLIMTSINKVTEELELTEPEPMWCDHIKKMSGKEYIFSPIDIHVSENFDYCPICGAKRP